MLKASFRVLRQHKRLLVFPALSITAEAVVIASFALPYAMTKHGSSVDATHLTPLTDVLFAICALVATTVSLFFTTGLFLATADAMNRGEVSVNAALRGAVRRLPTIVAWAVASCTVSLIVRVVDRRVPIASILFGVAWSCVSFLALPVMIFEGVGVRQGVRRAAAAFKGTWREQVVGTVRLGGLGLLLAIPAVLVFVIGIGTVNGPEIVLSIAICLLWLGLCTLVVSCLTGVYRVAVYRFVTSGVTPEEFRDLDLGLAFR